MKKRVLIPWNSLTANAKDWAISLILACLITMGLLGSGAVTVVAGAQDYRLDVSMELGVTEYAGIMNARVSGNGEHFTGVADVTLRAKSGREMRARITSVVRETEDDRYNLAYSASVLGSGETEPMSFEGDAVVFPTNDGYRITQIVQSGETTSSGTNLSSGTGLGLGFSIGSSYSKGTLALRFSDVSVSDGNGTLVCSEITLPGISALERG